MWTDGAAFVRHVVAKHLRGIHLVDVTPLISGNIPRLPHAFILLKH